MHEPDRERSPARARTVRMRVRVEAELTAAPAQEEPEGEVDDDEADRGLCGLLNTLRKNAVEKEDRNPEGEQRRRMAEAPGEPESPARPAARSCPLATSVVTAAR